MCPPVFHSKVGQSWEWKWPVDQGSPLPGLCSGFPGHVLVPNYQQVRAEPGLVSPVHLGAPHAVSRSGDGARCLSNVGTGGKSLASPGLASLLPGTGAQFQDMFLPATRDIAFNAAEQNKTQLWACSSLP